MREMCEKHKEWVEQDNYPGPNWGKEEMRHMCEADKVWFREEIRSAVRQVLYEEFGEVLKFLRFVKEEGDLDALAKMVNSGDEEAEDGEDGGEDVGRGKGYSDVLLP